MCESLVAPAQRLATELELAGDVDFVCGDVRHADLTQTGVLVLNDLLFPAAARRAVFTRAARALPPGAVVLSFKDRPRGLAAAAVDTNTRNQLHLDKLEAGENACQTLMVPKAAFSVFSECKKRCV